MNARYDIIKQDKVFRNYVCDALFCIGNLNVHYFELLENDSVMDDREPEEVIDHIKGKLRAMSEGN